MKLLKNVLIKLTRGGFTDRILYIDNVPEEMFYEMRYPRICVGKGFEQHWTDDTTQEKVPTLYEELHVSQTGDGAIMFDMDNEHASTRYLALNRYIRSVFPNNRVPQDPIVNSVDPSNHAASALELSKVPHVVLPVLSPAEGNTSVTGGATDDVDSKPSIDVEEIKRQAVKEYQEEQKERMRKAREAKTAVIGKNVQK